MIRPHCRAWRKKVICDWLKNVKYVTWHDIFFSFFLLYVNCFFFVRDDRPLADIFSVLPSKKDLPDYYHVIKQPVDIRKIKVTCYCSKATFCNAMRCAPPLRSLCTSPEICCRSPGDRCTYPKIENYLYPIIKKMLQNRDLI